jgi:hypothetical protein
MSEVELNEARNSLRGPLQRNQFDRLNKKLKKSQAADLKLKQQAEYETAMNEHSPKPLKPKSIEDSENDLLLYRETLSDDKRLEFDDMMKKFKDGTFENNTPAGNVVTRGNTTTEYKKPIVQRTDSTKDYEAILNPDAGNVVFFIG